MPRKARRSSKKTRKPSLLKKAALLLIGLLILYVGISFVYPSVGKLRKTNPKKIAMMEYREREWRDEGKNIKVRQYWVPLKAISPYLTKAVLIAEDDKFWHHEGFDFDGMEVALEKDIKKGKFKAGGSTITQQLAKNLYLSPSRNPIRKLKEAILAWRLEQALSKRRILEIYLNVAEWGEGIFGIEAASRHYFGKPASALSPEEAARLAVVLPNPRKLNPAAPSRYVERRSRIVYNIMVRRGIVMPEFEDVMRPEGQEEVIKPETPEAIQQQMFMGVSSMK